MRQAIAAVALLAALVTLAYWRLAIPGARYVWFDHYDMCQLEIPRLQFVARSLHEGRFPLWDPHVWAGLPVLGSAQPGPVYPLNLLFALLPLRDGLLPAVTLNWLFLAMHFIGAWSFYFLARGLKLSTIASLCGALIWSCLGYFGSAPWLDIGNGLSLTPLVFLFAWRLWGGGGVPAAIGLGGALGLSWLTGHHEVPLLNTYVVLLGSIGVALARRSPAVIAATALALTIAAGISAVQTLPLLEFGQQARRWVGAAETVGWADRVPYDVHRQYSLNWRDLAGLIRSSPTPEAHTSIFVGITATVLAAVALIRGWRLTTVRIGALLALAGCIYSLGANTPVHKLLYWLLPMMDKARTPVRGSYLLILGLALLGACGVQILSKRRAVSAAALLLILLEAQAVTRLRMTPAARPLAVCAADLFAHGPLAEQLRAASAGRAAVDYQQLMTNLGDLYGIDQLQSFVAAVPANILRHELHTSRTQALFGVTHKVGKSVMVTPAALPRAWLSYGVRRVRSVEELRAAIQNPSVDLTSTVLTLGGLPELEGCGPGQPLEVRRPDSDSVILEVTAACRGVVTLSDTYYPGWVASVDGRPATIHEVYGSFRGLVVERGQHTIHFEYKPLPVGIGVATTLLTSAVAAAVLLFRQRAS